MKQLLKTAAVCLFITAQVFAADVTVTVFDHDLDIPLEGAVITDADSQKTYGTDSSGTAVIPFPEKRDTETILVTLPGYNDTRAVIRSGEKTVKIELVMSGVVEGKELVVERAAPGKTDAKPGVSQVMNNAEMKTTAESGLIEDVMSSIKTLPGIGYAGGFNAQPSIRGGYASEMGTVMDGISVLNPWHWGGAYSIFNPLMVSSAKMSHGIFSARYGNVMSGLLEVTTKTPESDQVRVDASVSTMSSDMFVQLPFSKNAGVLFGGKLTYLEPLTLMYDTLGITNLADTIPTMPFIRDGYVKAYYNPSPFLHLTFNSFIGSDGVGIHADDSEDSITTTSSFSWLSTAFFSGLIAEWLPADSNQVKMIASYNQSRQDFTYKSDAEGTLSYTSDFITAHDDDDGTHDGKINGQTSYTLNGFSTDISSLVRLEQYQLKLEDTAQISAQDSISFGAEELVSQSHIDENAKAWIENTVSSYQTPILSNVEYTVTADRNRIFQTGMFGLWEFGNDTSLIQGEAGIRVDHCYVATTDNDYSLNTYPVVNPRLSVQYTPFRNKGIFDKIAFTAGTGLFSQISMQTNAIEKKYGLKDFDVSPDRLWFQVLGTEIDFAGDWHFNLEGYYKQYLNRLYIVLNDLDAGNVKYSVRTDGRGYVAGFDTMLQKKGGEKLDGYITYSFVYARFLNPYTKDYSSEETSGGDPLDTWYYPSFHRFNTVNLICNWRPRPGMTLTVKATVATGTPMEEEGGVTSYAAVIPNEDGTNTVVQRYTRSSVYSDTLRTQISCPVDLRLSVSNYYRHSKVRWEWYVGANDIFVNLYSPKANKSLNRMTGKESDTGQDADFNIGFPMPSVGMKISY
ncbi:MAG: TonB-dependent receptor plug domain-containing protein [Treponema sp.]|nr:TonB-dependent receptor plug domain-containing protein [Treponema sp.]